MTRKNGFTALVFLAAIIAVFFVTRLYQQNDKQVPKPDSSQTVCLKVSNSSAECDFNLDRATTNAERALGLSGRGSLLSKTGMLFVFDQKGEQCMWMKDMRFGIDMVWLNERKEIIKIEESVAPETYPKSFCSPETKYVVELSGGEARIFNLAIGQQLIF